MEKLKIGGLSLGGGGLQDKFFFCLLEYYPASKRWFAKLSFKKEGVDRETELARWIENFATKDIVVDFPLALPFCHHCTLSCPGMERCPVEGVKSSRERVHLLLQSSDVAAASKSLQKKLKRGFLPYWNRPIDVWVWEHYYDLLSHYFSRGFDCFGNFSLRLLSRFSYVKRQLPCGIDYFESYPLLCLLQLMQCGIVPPQTLLQLASVREKDLARANILSSIESKLKIFLYRHDFEFMVKNPRAFTAFLLATVGQRVILGELLNIPQAFLVGSPGFVLPCFARLK